MRRDLLLLGDMIEAAERARQLVADVTVEELQADRLGSESQCGTSPCSARRPPRFPTTSRSGSLRSRGSNPARLRNRIVHGYWSIDMEILHTTANDQLPSFAADLRKVLHALTADADDAPAPEADEPRSAAAGEQTSTTAPSPEGTATIED
jgi:uncharacterized protein with HEPN domain